MKASYPIVLVEWIDSNATGAWTTKERAVQLDDMSIISVGFLLADLPDRIILVGADAAVGTVDNAFTIPRVAIISVETIREA